MDENKTNAMSQAETKANLLTPLEQRIDQWKEQYKEVYELQTDDPEECPELASLRIICKRPDRTSLSRFVKEASSGDALKAQNNFFYGCLLYPDAEVIRNVAEQKPGIIIALGNKLQELTGTNMGFTMKKL